MEIGYWDIYVSVRKHRRWAVCWFGRKSKLTRSLVIFMPFFTIRLLKHKGPRHLGNIPYNEWPDWMRRLKI